MSDIMDNPTIDKMRQGLQRMQNFEDIELPMDPKFFENLHDKIMAKVDEIAIEPAPAMLAQRRFLRAHWREWLYPAGGVMALALVVGLVLSQIGQMRAEHFKMAKLNSSGEKVVAAAAVVPESITQTLLSSESESDFFVDVASQSIENLNISQFHKIMGEDRK